MSAGNVLRVALVLAAGVMAAGSATSSSSNPPPQQQPRGMAGGGQNVGQPPPPQQMEASAALGLWQTNFGAVKIEADNSKGGLQAGSVQGVWVYQRQGAEVIGYFAGNLRGNVLQFRWQEPNNPPLTGEGFLVFDPQGRQYNGRWWSDRKDRVGDWNGWRKPQSQQAYGNRDPYGGQYGGQAYGGYAPPPPARDPYRRPEPAPYQPPPTPRGYY
ncbi:MAG: hypothetical protein ACKV2T_05005 [Kofleriaceae bacterium]